MPPRKDNLSPVPKAQVSRSNLMPGARGFAWRKDSNRSARPGVRAIWRPASGMLTPRSTTTPPTSSSAPTTAAPTTSSAAPSASSAASDLTTTGSGGSDSSPPWAGLAVGAVLVGGLGGAAVVRARRGSP